MDLSVLVAAVAGARPGLAGGAVTVHDAGWDSVAIEIAGEWICKFPRHAAAEARLRRESGLLSMLRGRTAMNVPRMEFIDGPIAFSIHRKLPGRHLPPAAYAALDAPARDRLAGAVSGFLADLHAIPPQVAAAAGAVPVGGWTTAADIAPAALPLLTPPSRDRARKALDAWSRLPPDPLGEVYGFFDCHGWNMAFDHDSATLTGIYDFGDSGLGPLHREFVHTSLISPDLTRRVLDRYGPRTGRLPDRRRIALLTAVHRLWELASAGSDDDHRQQMAGNAEAWLGLWPGPESAGPLGPAPDPSE